MIGQLISMKFIGEEDWKSALFFWIGVLIAGFVVVSLGVLAGIAWLSTIVILAIAIGIAMRFFQKDFMQAVIIVAVGVVIDIVLMSLFGGVFFGFAFIGGVFGA